MIVFKTFGGNQSGPIDRYLKRVLRIIFANRDRLPDRACQAP